MKCSHCQFPIHSDSGLRHYGTHVAHQENECLRLLMADRDRLQADVASLTAQLQSGESFHAVAVRQRDAAWREVEALKSKVETLKQNDARYRFIREDIDFDETVGKNGYGSGHYWLNQRGYLNYDLTPERRPEFESLLDSAIDAARPAKGERR